MTDSASDLRALVGHLGVTCEGGWVKNREVKCTRLATHIVKFHNLDRCRAASLDPDGNQVRMCCPACTASTSQLLGELLGEMYANLPDVWECPVCESPVDGETCLWCGAEVAQFVSCQSCGKRLEQLSDLFTTELLRG